jgi:peptidyl-prolyl cis-trans isomerase D
MFDLFRSRDKAVRYLLGGLLMIVALSMVVTLIPGSTSSARADDNVIAEVGKDVITVREVQSQLQNMVRGRQVPPEMLQVYAPQFIDQMITDRAAAYEARRLGFEVPDSELAAAIRRIVPQLFNNGQLIDKQAYENMLAERGMSIPEFEANVRKQILVSRLENLVTEGIVVTPQEVQQFYDTNTKKAKIEYISFKPENLKSAVVVTPQDLKTYYEANKTRYTEPEKRSLALLVADQEKIGASIEVSDQQLRAAYDRNRDQYRTPERVHVRHILIKTAGKPPAEQDKLKAKAEDLLKKVKAGGDFAAIAKVNSEDTGSAEKGGDLGWVVRGQTVKNFENTAFALKPNEISNVVTTEYGFHIIQALEKQDAHTQPFEEVKAQLATEAKKQVVFDRMQSSIDQARAALQKNPNAIDQVASQYHLELVKAEKIGPGQPLPVIGPVPDLDAALAGLKKGDVTPVFQAGNDKLVVAEVTDVLAPRVPPFEEVESKVRDVVVDQKSQTLATERANQAATRLKAGEDIAKVAKDLGGEVKTSNEFTKNEAIEGVGQGSLFEDAFTRGVGTVIGPVPAANQTVVAKVVAQIPADPAKFAGERDGIVTQLKQKKAQERREMFYDSILARLIKEGKVKKHNDTIKRLIANYRG